MTSFAVVKDTNADRLISWPRSQNSLFLEPPEVDLPDTSLFSRFHVAARSEALGFACDVSNMFHNLQLPGWLVYYFALKSVSFGDLGGDAQRQLISALKLSKRPPQNARFRPHQRTVAMGWSWAVAIAHGVASGAIRRAVAQVSVALHHKVRFKHFSRNVRHDVLVLHIIDDVNAIGFGVPQESMVLFQEQLYGTLERCGLPLKASKGTLSVTFRSTLSPS